MAKVKKKGGRAGKVILNCFLSSGVYLATDFGTHETLHLTALVLRSNSYRLRKLGKADLLHSLTWDPETSLPGFKLSPFC